MARKILDGDNTLFLFFENLAKTGSLVPVKNKLKLFYKRFPFFRKWKIKPNLFETDKVTATSQLKVSLLMDSDGFFEEE